MKTILMVDDDASSRSTMIEAFRGYRDAFSVEVASDEGQAAHITRTRRVDLVLVDTHMPRLAGFRFMAYVHHHHPTLPVVLMSTRATVDAHRSPDRPMQLRSISKPLDGDALVCLMREYLAHGQSPGVTPLGLLRALHQERKTCALRFRSEGRQGMLHLLLGEIIHAHCKGAEGEEAAFQILSWPTPRIQVLPQVSDPKMSLTTRMELLLTEADHRAGHPSLHPQPPPQVPHPMLRRKDAGITWQVRSWNVHATRRLNGWLAKTSKWRWADPASPMPR